MEALKTLSICMTVALSAALSAPVLAQTVREDLPNPPQEKPIAPSEHPMLFSPSPEDPVRSHSVVFRSEEQMTERDKIVVADAEASIGEHAGFMGLEFNSGGWSYEQVVCPALPNHVFLKFLRNNGTGDVSMFTASIPREGDGRVRIIPIRLRGYSLFSPAPINALTISAFNHIRAEEHPDRAPDWLGTGLCYAALAGGHPQAAMLSEVKESQTKYPTAPTATLEVPTQGGAVLSFTDVSTSPKPMEWSMVFDSKGRLLKAIHAPETLAVARTLHAAAVDERGVRRQDAAAPVVTPGAAPAPPVVAIKPDPAPAAVPTTAGLSGAELVQLQKRQAGH
jgi:hypothetical protein